MCEWGNVETMEIVASSEYAADGEVHKKTIDVDSCIAPIVRALNEAGIKTIASCCGHGERVGIITLERGRNLLVLPDDSTEWACSPEIQAALMLPTIHNNSYLHILTRLS